MLHAAAYGRDNRPGDTWEGPIDPAVTDEQGGPPGGGVRRGAIDVARVGALLVVVVGHLTLAVVDVGPDGEIRGVNLLELRPSWSWAAVFAPMPVFFAAAGWANARTGLGDGAVRLRTLVGLGAVVVGAWSGLVAVATVVAGDPGIVGDGARMATQPLWFLAAYLPMAAAGPQLARAVTRRPVLLPVGVLVALAALDLLRFRFDGPAWPAWAGFLLAWGVPWVLGAWWRERWERGLLCERATGAVLLAVGGAAAATLVAVAGYEAALIDTVDTGRSNTTPPTLYTSVVAVAQVGALVLVAGLLDRAFRRWERWWRAAGGLAVGVYMWHLSALALCVGVIALGLPVPDRLSGLWWVTRPVWWLAVLGLTAALVALTAGLRRPPSRTGSGSAGQTGRTAAGARLWAGVVTGAAAAALVGMEGPRTVVPAALCTGGFVGAWWLLGVANPDGGGPRSRTGAATPTPAPGETRP